MNIEIFKTKPELGRRAAEIGGKSVTDAIAARGKARIIVATGASQFDTLAALVKQPSIDWSVVECFHLDEYVGMAETHPASFRKYLRERFVNLLPKPLAAFHGIDAQGDCTAECQRLAKLIAGDPIDVAFIGIGENGHLAFNDPPADLKTEAPYIVVGLDEACRKQQFGEGWFPTLANVPTTAISMSIRQIMKSRQIVCSVPDERKAKAVQGSVEGPVTPNCPGSMLQQHTNCSLLLDEPAASLLKR